MKNLIQFFLFAIALAVGAAIAYTCQVDINDTIVYATAPLVSTNYMRSRYIAFVEWLYNNGYLNSMEDNAIITETGLRMNAIITAGASVLNFNLKKGTDTDGPGERRLATDNIFFITHIGLYLQKIYVSGASLIADSNYPLLTFPDPNHFAGAAAGNDASEADSLNLIYDGKLTLNSAGIDRLNEVLTEDLKFVPDSQTVNVAAPQTQIERPQWGPTFEGRGLKEMHGNQVILGKLENKATLYLGSGNKALIHGTATIGNRAVLKFHGFEFSGSFTKDKGGVC